MLIELIALHSAAMLDTDAQARQTTQVPPVRAERVMRPIRDKQMPVLKAEIANPDREALLKARKELDEHYRARRISAEVYSAANLRNAIALRLLEDSLKELEAEDKLGNFEIQDLMSTFNQSQQTASSVQKKQDDTANSVISKVG